MAVLYNSKLKTMLNFEKEDTHISFIIYYSICILYDDRYLAIYILYICTSSYI